MNKHFEDTRYYIGRAGEEAKRGVAAELEPVRQRVERLTGEDEPEPGRLERLRARIDSATERAAGKSSGVAGTAREKLSAVRRGKSS